MEVGTKSTAIHLTSNRHMRVVPAARSSMSHSENHSDVCSLTGSSQMVQNYVSPSKQQPLSLEVDPVPSSSASDVTDPSPVLLSLTPPPENDQEKDGRSNDASNGTAISPKETTTTNTKKRKRKEQTMLEAVKARITRNREDANEVVVNNYVDSSERKQVYPRVIPPTGLRRIPFKPPKGELEKAKDKLQINMVGPKTKTSMNAMEDANKKTRSHNQISEGPEYQAKFNQYLAEDFQQPTGSVDDIPDRDDEVMWIDDRVKLKDRERELDEAWTAVRRQYGGKIGLDSMLRRLMKCDYDIDEMLMTIEQELFDLSQPFEPFNVAQQAEFERLLRKNPEKPSKNFRQMQERFLKSYYLGEIVQYYYNTKHKGCYHKLNHRCQCRENIIREFAPVPRYECYNCARYIWMKIIPEKIARFAAVCPVCELYYARKRKHRYDVVKLSEPEEKLAWAFFNLEKERKAPQSRQEFLKYMEEQRQNRLRAGETAEDIPTQYHNGKVYKPDINTVIELSKKFVPGDDPDCWVKTKWGKEVRNYAMKEYTASEKIAFLREFQSKGKNFKEIAESLQVHIREIQIFYNRFNKELGIDEMISPKKKVSLLGGAPFNLIFEPLRSDSGTPEPSTSKRKRGTSVDPAYEIYRGAPLAKTTRRTRHTPHVYGAIEERNSPGQLS